MTRCQLAFHLHSSLMKSGVAVVAASGWWASWGPLRSLKHSAQFCRHHPFKSLLTKFAILCFGHGFSVRAWKLCNTLWVESCKIICLPKWNGVTCPKINWGKGHHYIRQLFHFQESKHVSSCEPWFMERGFLPRHFGRCCYQPPNIHFPLSTVSISDL